MIETSTRSRCSTAVWSSTTSTLLARFHGLGLVNPAFGSRAEFPGEGDIARRHRLAVRPCMSGLSLKVTAMPFLPSGPPSAPGRSPASAARCRPGRSSAVLVRRGQRADGEAEHVALDQQRIDRGMQARRELGDADDEVVLRRGGRGRRQRGRREEETGRGHRSEHSHRRSPSHVQHASCRAGGARQRASACIVAETASGRHRSDRDAVWRSLRNRYPGAAGPAALGAVPLAGGDRARHHLDPGRARGHPGRLARQRDHRTARSRISTSAEFGADRQRLSGRAPSSAHWVFGWLTDRLGRKKLFTITLLLYLVATVASGFAWNFWSFALFRFLTGAGIGGEYAAVNATIQELIPARKRGFTDLVHQRQLLARRRAGRCRLGVVLDPECLRPQWGWRLAFVIGGVIGLVVLFLRSFIPESPRWLMTHGQPEAASQVVHEIEERVEHETGRELPPVPDQTLRLRRHRGDWFLASLRVLFVTYPQRTVLGVALMGSQAFCYNAVLFTYALVLTQFYQVPRQEVGLVHAALRARQLRRAAAARPAVRQSRPQEHDHRHLRAFRHAHGRGRLGLRAGLAQRGASRPPPGRGIFFFASAAASSAYLTVGETFPLEVRAIAIAVFYALGTGDRRHRRPGCVRRADPVAGRGANCCSATCSAAGLCWWRRRGGACLASTPSADRSKSVAPPLSAA